MNLEWVQNPMLLLVNALAVYRLTRLHIRDSLPPLPWLRDTVRKRATESYGRPVRWWSAQEDYEFHASPVLYLIDCFWCVSFWWGVAATAMMSLWPQWWMWFAVPLAFSALTGLASQRDRE